MAQDLFDYPQMVEAALRGVMREALARTAREGLPGEHHFYVTFRTHAPGVSIPKHLRDKISRRDDDRAAAPIPGAASR